MSIFIVDVFLTKELYCYKWFVNESYKKLAHILPANILRFPIRFSRTAIYRMILHQCHKLTVSERTFPKAQNSSIARVFTWTMRSKCRECNQLSASLQLWIGRKHKSKAETEEKSAEMQWLFRLIGVLHISNLEWIKHSVVGADLPISCLLKFASDTFGCDSITEGNGGHRLAWTFGPALNCNKSNRWYSSILIISQCTL